MHLVVLSLKLVVVGTSVCGVQSSHLPSMADAAKKKAMAKLFKTKKKKTSSRKKAEAEA